MNKVLLLGLLTFILAALPARSRAQGPDSAAGATQAEFGFGFGASVPFGDLGDEFSPGPEVLAKLRLLRPRGVNFLFTAMLNTLGGNESQAQLMLGAGFEAGRRGLPTYPYFGADLYLVRFSNEGAAEAFYRGGVGLGGGLAWPLGDFGRLDASLRYQVLNLMGGSKGDGAVSQLSVTLCVMPAL